MVAIFTGLGAGFERGSSATLGASGLLGSASFGRDGQGLYLNAANGNLMITDQDEFLVGRGPDVGISRTYNSFGALDENGDRWRQSTDRRVFGLSGTANTADSFVRRVSPDGSEIVYTWNGSFYEASAGEGATDRLSYSTSTGLWTWTDGYSQITETYEAYGTNNWRIVEQTDSDGNNLTFTYTADKLTRITTDDGGYTDYIWSGSNITSIVAGYTNLVTSTSATLTRTRYEYDGQNRLIKVTTDLTPGDNSIVDGQIYATEYTYHGSSKLIASISQTDGARVDITYDARGRVTEIVQAVVSGNSRTTSIDYEAYRTVVTDPNGQETKLSYDAVGQLTKVEAPAAQLGAAPQVYEYQYAFPPENLSAQGVDIVKQGAPSPGGTPVDWTVASEVVEGRSATSIRKPWSYRQPWDDWNMPGSIYLKGGDRFDGSFSVTAGETVGYRIATHRLDDARYVAAKIVFVDAASNVLGSGGEDWSNVWGWGENTGVAVAPTGAVAAYVEVSAGDWGAESDAQMGAAFVDLQFHKLPAGATSMPQWTASPNLMRGGDMSFGASIVVDGWGDTPWLDEWDIGLATVGGREAITFSRDSFAHWVSPYTYTGPVAIVGGDLPDGRFSVTAGDVIGIRFSAHLLGAATDVVSVIRFYNEAGDDLGEYFQSWSQGSGWFGEGNAVRVPEGVTAARLEINLFGWDVPVGTEMGAAISQIQVHKLPYNAVQYAGTDVPEWDDAAPVGKLLKVIGPDGSRTGYGYDAAGNIAAVTDANGNTVQRVYDAHNNLIIQAQTGAHAGGASAALYTRYVYDTENHLRYAISAEGRVTEYSYTAAGDLEFTRQYTQAAHLYALGVTVPTLTTMDAWRDGLADRSLINISQIVYDDRGAVKETKRYGAATTAGAAVTTSGWSQQLFTYDQAGQLLNRTVAGQQTESFVYDGMGRVILATDLAGGATKFFFNDTAATTVVTTATSAGAETADSYVTTSVYNKAGELISRTDRGSSVGGDYTNGGTRTSLYDKNGQLRLTTDATGFNSYFLYDKTGRKIADIGHGGQIVEYRYDQAGHLVATVRYTNALSSGQIASLADPNDEVEIASIRPSAHAQDIWQWSVYDAAGRIIETIAGDGSVTRYQYDQSDRLVATTGYYNKLTGGQIIGFMATPPTALVLPSADARDAIARTFYDRDGAVIGSLNAEGILSRIVYDGAGQKIQETVFAKAASASLRASGTFDQLLASVGSNPAADITTRYVYGGQGLLRWTVNALNQVTEYIYWEGTATQAVGLVRKTVVYADPIGVLTVYNGTTLAAATASLASDPDNRVTYNVYNDRAQLSYSVAATGAVTGFVYDTLGRVTKATQFAVLAGLPLSGAEAAWKGHLDTWAASNSAGARITRSYYSERGELRFSVDAEGYVTQNDYDDEGRLYTQRRYPTKVTATDGWVIGDVDSAGKGTAVATQFRYDTLGRLSDTYDGLGVRRTTLYYANGTKQYEIVAYGQGTDEVRTLYAYNQAGQLTQTFHAAATAEQIVESYAYDGFGNLISVTDARNNTTSFTHDKLGRVLTQTNAMSGVSRFGYDAFGRKVVDVDPRGARTYTYYDQAGRAISVIDAEGYVTNTIYTAFGEIQSVTRHANRAASIYSASWWPAGGTGYTVAAEAIDGGLVLTARNAVGEIPGWHWAAWGGEVTVMPGNLGDGHMAVAPGDTIALSVDAKALTPGLTVHAKFTFKRADGSSVDGGWTDVTADADWTTISTSMAAPADAVSVWVGLYSYRPDANVNGGFDFAVRGLKILRNGVEHVIENPSVAADANDATTTFQYDKLGRVTRTTDAEAGYEQYTLDAFGQRTAVRSKLGGVTANTYDKRGFLTQEVLPIATHNKEGVQQSSTVTNQFEYDAYGNRTMMIEAAGLIEQRTTQYGYDAVGRLTSRSGDAVSTATSSTGGVSTSAPTETYDYDRRGNVIESRDATGAPTFYWHDKLDRLTHTVSALGALTRNFYDDNGNLTEARVYATPLSPVPTDALGTAPAGTGAYRATLHTFDAINRMTQSRVASIQTATYASGLTVTTQDLVTTIDFDAAGNVVKATDARGGQTWSWYDKLGRKTVQIDAANYRTDWSYDSDGNVVQERRYASVSTAPSSTSAPPSAPSQAADDRVTTFGYDKMGRRTTETRASVQVHNGSGAHSTQNATISYAYNGLGQVTQKTEATGDAVSYTYDVGGRMTMEQRSGFVDFNGNWQAPIVDYTYNGLGDLTRSRQYGATGAWERTTKYEYGAGGHLSRLTDAEGFARDYVYDKAGRVIREEYTLGSDRSAIGYDYDLEGRVTGQGLVAYISGSWGRTGLDHATTVYNAFGEATERKINGVTAETYAYDDAGRLWRTTGGDGAWKYFMYDAAGNQTLAIASDGMNIANQSLGWVLDRWGSNRAAIATTNVADIVATITQYDKRNQATFVREPQREVHVSGSLTLSNLTTERSYNAFGEIDYEINTGGHRIDYLYNTMGRQIEVKSPTVSITLENGTTQSVRPTEHKYYDVSGRLVASRDANGNLTRLQLLAGTGYGGSQALVSEVKTADNATVTTGYDIHGEARLITDQIGRVTTQLFDRMGRLLDVTRAGLIEYHRYDALGQKTQRWNTQLGFGNAEVIAYDRQGRMISHTAMGGDVTSYVYAQRFDAGAFAGWRETATYANGKTSVEDTDRYGREVSSTDLGGNVSTSIYDNAGRLVRRTGGDALNYTYFNTGRLESSFTFTGSYESDNWIWKGATYGYDLVGNLTVQKQEQQGEEYYWVEPWTEEVWEGENLTLIPHPGYWHHTFPAIAYSNAAAAYDGLGRMTSWNEAGTQFQPEASIAYAYDANGNIRRSQASFRTLDAQGSASSSASTQDYWYRHDALNRVVTTKGALSGGAIVRGANGTDLEYDLAGQRVKAVTSFQDTRPFWGTPFTNTRREDFAYDGAGRLLEVRINQGTYENPGLPSSAGIVRGTYAYDLMGRMTSQMDFRADGVAAYHRWIAYNDKSQITVDNQATLRSSSNHVDRTETTNAYTDIFGNNYALGAVVRADTNHYTNNTFQRASRSENQYQWRDGAQLSWVGFTYNVAQVGSTGSTHEYAIVGGQAQLIKVDVNDGRPRDVFFLNDMSGQAFWRGEQSISPNGDPQEIWYRFGAKQMGYISNNGTLDTGYALSIDNRQTGANPGGGGAFRFGATTATPHADFDQGVAPLNSYGAGSLAGGYAVRSGDTLSSIAATLWGDASLWYRLAEANGLSGQSPLMEGQNLVVPAGVYRSTHTAATFTPYDPAKTIGDVGPTTPIQPKPKGNQCGVMGQVILLVIAAAVTWWTRGATKDWFAAVLGDTIGAIATGATAGAAGSVASQSVGVATNIQEKFSWNAVAMAAIEGGVNGGLAKSGPLKGNGGWQTVARGMISNAVSQGVANQLQWQRKFDFAGVAAAGAISGIGAINLNPAAAFAAKVIAGAGTRSLIDGTDFGDNVLAILPSVIGSTIGEMIAGGIQRAANEARTERARQAEEAKREQQLAAAVGITTWDELVANSRLPEKPKYLSDGLVFRDTDAAGYGILNADGAEMNLYNSYAQLGGKMSYEEWRATAADRSWQNPVNQYMTGLLEGAMMTGLELLSSGSGDAYAILHPPSTELQLTARVTGGALAPLGFYGKVKGTGTARSAAAAESEAIVAAEAVVTNSLEAARLAAATRFAKADAALVDLRITDAGLRRQMVDAGFDPAIMEGASAVTVKRFDRLFQGTLDRGKTFAGVWGSLETRIATMTRAMQLENAGYKVEFEVRYPGSRRGTYKWADLEATRGNEKLILQFETNPNSRNALANQKWFQKFDIPVEIVPVTRRRLGPVP